jgi:hypothetical protein
MAFQVLLKIHDNAIIEQPGGKLPPMSASDTALGLESDLAGCHDRV